MASWLPPLLLLWQQAERPKTILERLDPVRRTSVLMALLGLILIGLMLLLLVRIGGRTVRRLARDRRRGTPTGQFESSWKKPEPPVTPPGPAHDDKY